MPRPFASFVARTALSRSSPATQRFAKRIRRPIGPENRGRGIRVPTTALAASRERIEAREPEEDQDPVRDAQRSRDEGDDAPDTLRVPPLERIRQGESEGDHAHNDADAEDRDAANESRERGHAEPEDEEVHEFVVAREAVEDPDAEHGAMFAVPAGMDVGVLVLDRHGSVAVAVDVPELRKDPELPREAERADRDQHDAHEVLEGPQR